jgi:hypothetical protein
VILDLFFVLPYLLLHLMQSRIKHSTRFFSVRFGNEVVFMLCINENFDLNFLMLEINCDLDLSNSLEIGQKLLRPFENVSVCFRAKRSMAADDIDLHWIVLPGSDEFREMQLIKATEVKNKRKQATRRDYNQPLESRPSMVVTGQSPSFETAATHKYRIQTPMYSHNLGVKCLRSLNQKPETEQDRSPPDA